jgi:hypothetical protein
LGASKLFDSQTIFLTAARSLEHQQHSLDYNGKQALLSAGGSTETVKLASM